jgi:hypothetical protein
MSKNLIVNVGKNKYREVLKAIREPLKKRKQVIEQVGEGSVRVSYIEVTV